MKRLIVFFAAIVIAACSDSYTPIYEPVKTNPETGKLSYPKVKKAEFERLFIGYGWELLAVHKVYNDGTIDDQNILWAISEVYSEGYYPRRMAVNSDYLRHYYLKYNSQSSDDASFLFDEAKLYINYHPGAVLGDKDMATDDICIPIYGIDDEILEAMVDPTMMPAEDGVIAHYLRYQRVDADTVEKWNEEYEPQMGGNIDSESFVERIANKMLIIEEAYAITENGFERVLGDQEVVARMVFYSNGESYGHTIRRPSQHSNKPTWVEADAVAYTYDSEKGKLQFTLVDNTMQEAVLMRCVDDQQIVIDGNLTISGFSTFKPEVKYRYICSFSSVEERLVAEDEIYPSFMYCLIPYTEVRIDNAPDFDDDAFVEKLIATERFNSTIGFTYRTDDEWDHNFVGGWFEIDFKKHGNGEISYKCCDNAPADGHSSIDGVIAVDNWSYDADENEISIFVDVFTDSDIIEKQITIKVLWVDDCYAIFDGNFMNIYSDNGVPSCTQTQHLYSNYQRIFCKLATPDRTK